MPNRIIAGIDIGSTKVAAVIAIDEEGQTPRVIGEASYVASGIKKGEITGIDEAINSIASALAGAERMAGLTVSSVYVTINGKHIVSNNNKGVVAIAENEIVTEDVMRAMEQAKTVAIPPAREIIHLLPREFVVDTQSGIKDPVGMTGTRLEVDAHIISATTTALHNLRKCVQSIGLRIDKEVFSGWSASQSVLTPTEKELGVLLLDFGGGTTTITTFEEGAVTYSTSIPFGGTNVTRDLAAGLRLSLDDAEKVKLNMKKMLKESKGDDKEDKGKDILDVSDLEIEGVKTISRKLLTEIVDARIEEVFQLVRDTLAQANYEYKLPAGVVITGGSAEIPGITNIAKAVFKMPARIGYPRGLDGLTDGISGPAYAAVQGLILYGINDDGLDIGSNAAFTPAKPKAGDIVQKVTGFFKNLMP